MKQPIDLARQYLAVAQNDIKAFQRLADDVDIADASVGFHAQQAVEKCLKAVLALRSIIAFFTWMNRFDTNFAQFFS